MSRFTVTIGLPPKAVSPNFRSRTHHAKARATAAYRAEGYAVGLAERFRLKLPSPAFDRATITATFYCGPTKIKAKTGKDDRCRPTDGDNAAACLKSAIDGLRSAGLFPDDDATKVRLMPPVIKRLKADHQGRAEVVLEIEPWEDPS